METRANYVLIGAFTLVGLIGALGFLLWLAKVEVDRSYAYYDVLFEDVSGLGDAADVRYNGLPVGQVVAVHLDRQDPSQVRVTLEMDASIPVKTDTEATLEMQGVTGVSYVSLSGGTPGAERLASSTDPDERAVIPSRQSAVQSLFQGAPELLNRAIELIEQVNGFASDDNQMRVNEIFANVADASGKLDQVLEDVSKMTAAAGTASEQLQRFSARLEGLVTSAETTLANADQALGATTDAVRKAEGTMDAANATLESAGAAFASADAILKEQAPALLAQTTETVKGVQDVAGRLETQANAAFASADALMSTTIPQTADRIAVVAEALQTTATQVGGKAGETLDQFAQAGAEATKRLAEAETTLADLSRSMARAETLMASLERTSASVDAFVKGDAAALAAEARGTLETARGLMSRDLPPLIEEARAATAKAEGLIEEARGATANVNEQVTVLSGQAGALMTEAGAGIVAARATLGRADTALDQATLTMASVQAATAEISAVVTTDGAALVAEARGAVTQAREAIDGVNRVVQQDVPAIVADVRDAAATASDTVRRVSVEVDAMLDKVSATVDSMTGEGLGLTGRLDELLAQAEGAVKTAADTFANANGTLAAISGTMERADGALGAAESTFTQVNGLLDGDVRAAVADLRTSMATLNGAVTGVTEDVQLTSVQIRDASASANRLMGSLDGLLQNNTYEVNEFLRTGLPQFTRFVEEARRLVENLSRLSAKVERDPARFLLGTQSSEFRR